MLKRSTLLHLRIPFSFYLMPVFWFAFSQSENYTIANSILVFIIVHIFLYPASNGYNSYFDKDEESIGGLEKPPAVSKELYVTSLIFDLIAVVAGLFISWKFAGMLFIYGLVSKAYSHPAIRLKKYPFISWFIAGFFQGFFSFIMIIMGIEGENYSIQTSTLIAALLTSMLLWGSYPMTQIYQHREDKKRGDITLSLKLGIIGTFIFTAIMFTVADLGYLFFFIYKYSVDTATIFQLFLVPVLIYFFYWLAKVRRNHAEANFHATMKLNFISAACMNAFFILLSILY